MLKADFGGVLRPALLCVLLAGPITACSGDGSGPTETGEPVIARILISPDSAVVAIGETQTFSAQALTSAGSPVSGRTVQWSSDKQTVATVDGSGVMTAAGIGTAKITATVDGIAASVSVRVPEPPPAEVTISPDSAVLFIGQSQTLTARAYDAAGAELSGRTVQWSTSDANMVSVTDAGAVTGRGAGSATITATVDGTSATVTVRARENPVKATSYENFKEIGLLPITIPSPFDANGTSVVAHAYGDFYQRGAVDLFTARIVYTFDQTLETATMAEYTFWRRDGDSFIADNTILAPPTQTCIHPRKSIVADFNLDGRPDIFIACHGYDADPYPGERDQVVLSQSDGSYVVHDAAPDIQFSHGASAADLNGDGYPDVVVVAGNERMVLLNNQDGTFTRETENRLPGDPTWGFEGRLYFTVELIDVNEDGLVDLVLGGHEWETAENPGRAGVWLNPGNYQFAAVTPVIIPAVPNEGVVVDFAVTGTGSTRTIWLSRTSGGDGTFYESKVLQRFDWSTGASSVVVNERPAVWVPWIIPYTRNGTLYVGSDDLRTPMEYSAQ